MGLIKLIIFGFVGVLILGIILNIHEFLDDCGLTPSAWKEAREEKEARKAREAQARKDSIFNDWRNRLASIFNIIEGHILYGQFYDPQGQYESIWLLEHDHPDDGRCAETFKSVYKNHVNWLADIFNSHIELPGYLAIPTCISVLRCLREAYHEDASFDYAISVLENLYDAAGRVDIYLKFNQYGDCMFNGDAQKTTLDQKIAAFEQKLQLLEASISNGMGNHYENIDSNLPDFVACSAGLMWCIAAKKPFDQVAFDKAAKKFDRYTARCYINKGPTRYYLVPKKDSGYVEICHVEHLLALVYAKNQIGGKNTVNQEKKLIMDWVNAAVEFDMTNQCYLLPSALAWMGLYELERDVLRYLVEKKVNLPEEWQDRLGFLESGGTSNIRIYDISSQDGFLYDASATDWNSEAFDLFFRKLEMTHKPLQYSLAMSKWAKTLPLASGQKISQEQIEQEFIKLVDDFDGEVSVSKERAKAINLANVEYENSFIFKFMSERNRCVSILFSSEKYGRNLNVTIITMFTPENGLNNEQLKTYALAIKDNLYIQSFRESVLQVVDQVTKEKQTIYDDEPTKKIFS